MWHEISSVDVTKVIGKEKQWVDVFIPSEGRVCDVEFKDGLFKQLIFDYDGDYDYSEDITSQVTHFMVIPEDPVFIPVEAHK